MVTDPLTSFDFIPVSTILYLHTIYIHLLHFNAFVYEDEDSTL